MKYLLFRWVTFLVDQEILAEEQDVVIKNYGCDIAGGGILQAQLHRAIEGKLL